MEGIGSPPVGKPTARRNQSAFSTSCGGRRAGRQVRKGSYVRIATRRRTFMPSLSRAVNARERRSAANPAKLPRWYEATLSRGRVWTAPALQCAALRRSLPLGPRSGRTRRGDVDRSQTARCDHWRRPITAWAISCPRERRRDWNTRAINRRTNSQTVGAVLGTIRLSPARRYRWYAHSRGPVQRTRRSRGPA